MGRALGSIGVIILLTSRTVCVSGENLEGYTRLIANVSLLIADYYSVKCLQIFCSTKFSHTKRETIYEVWKTLSLLDNQVTSGIYTYEGYLKRKKGKPHKVSCYRSLKIMSDEEESRKGYGRLTRVLGIKDAVWVLFSKRLALEFFKYAQISFDDVIIIAVIKGNHLVLFYEIYRVSPNFPLKILPLGNWTDSEGLALPKKAFYDRRSDLEGVVIKTASTENWPATYSRGGKWKGFLVKVWDEIKNLINCSSISVRSAKNYIGMRMKNGSWNGLVGMAMRGEIDFILSEIVIDKERSHALKFLTPVMKTRFQIYTRHLGYEWQWAAVLRPFHLSVWLAAVTWILVGTVFITFCYHMCLRYGLELMDMEKMYTPLKSFLFIMQALCQQGYHVIPNSYTCRLLFFITYALPGVLIPSYSASLVSSLAQKIHFRSFDSLHEMVADGTYRLLVRENSAQHAFFIHTNDEFLKKSYLKLTKGITGKQRKMGMKRSIAAICRLPNYAVMGIEEIVEVRMTGSRKPDCPVVPLKYPVSTIYLTMATARRSPFWGVINHHLQKLLINGIVSRLKLQEFPSADPNKVNSEKEVGMKQLVFAFAFIGLFTLASIFILLLEIQYHVYKTYMFNKKKNRRRKRYIQRQKAKIIYEYELQMSKKVQTLL